MIRFVLSALLFAVFIAAFAFRMFAGEERRRYFKADLLLNALFAAAISAIPLLPLAIPLATLLGLLMLLKLGALLYFLARSATSRWTAWSAAVLAFAFYVALMPFAAQAPLDGDEPYYLLAAESVGEDLDLELTNQYRDLATSPLGRTDVRPHVDDPVGPNGEHYSRHEPLLAILLAPAYAVAGVPGALLTMALFGALLARSVFRLFEDEGLGREASTLLFAAVMFAPPVLNYATRIWPEVPAALFFVEAVRGLRQRRGARFGVALTGLLLIKLRFVPVGAVLLLFLIGRSRRPLRAVAALLLLLIPFGVLWFVKGDPLGMHAMWELMPREPWRFARGAFGLVLDGAGGIAFRAPLLLLGVLSLSRWRSIPAAARVALLASVPYLLLLAIRDEWHGGWAPPLRYLVFLVPFLALAAAALIDRARMGVVPVLLSIWTCFLALHSIAYPWRLFTIAGGENFAGEWLSRLHQNDFSRLYPSFIRINEAAWIAVAIFVVALLVSRWWLPAIVAARSPLIVGALALLLAMGARQGTTAGDRVELEDAHVEHAGGALDPEQWTVARFRFDSGWRLSAGDSSSFLFSGGPSQVRYGAASAIEVELGGRKFALPATEDRWSIANVAVPGDGRTMLRMTRGTATFDWIERVDR